MNPLRFIARIADRSFELGLSALAKIPGLRKVFARFEAAYTNWGVRRWLQTTYQDARFEVDFSSTMEMCRKHLYFVQNSWIVNKIRNLKIQFAVGVEGLRVVPNASDAAMDKEAIEAWNEARAVRWDDWCKSPELGSNLSLAELCQLWEGNLFDVGNIIIHKTRDARGTPKIQTIDRLRLQTPPDLRNEENKTIIQGIELEKIVVTDVVLEDGKSVTRKREIVTGKPAFYWIRDEFGNDANGSVPSTFTRVPASQIIHKFRCLRPGMMVGVPDGYAVLNLIQDYDELHILEMQCAKLAGEIATVEANVSGELTTTQMRRTRLNITSPNTLNQNVSRDPGQYYDLTLGGKKIAMRIGDSLKNFQVDRPSIVQQGYWDLLATQICAGYNVPKLLVMPFSLQGTVTRADLDVSSYSTAFRGDFEVIASVVREIYEWQGRYEVDYNTKLSGKFPKDYARCVIRPPRPPNVDVGYTASAEDLQLRNGTKTLQDVYADRNQDWHVQIRQIAETASFIKRLAKDYDLEPEQISDLMKLEAPPAADPQNEPEKEPVGA